MNEEKKVYYTYVVVYILNFLSATLYTTYTNFFFFFKSSQKSLQTLISKNESDMVYSAFG